MLRLTDIPSERAEISFGRINEVLASYRFHSVGLSPTMPRFQELARDAILRLVAEAETFTGEHLIDRAEQDLPLDHELVARLWDDRGGRVVRDWPGRKAAWKQLYGVEWNYAYRNEFDAFVMARNIIAHGIGRLTQTQLVRGSVKKGVRDQLRHADLQLDGFLLRLRPVDVERCGIGMRRLIEWLDEQSRLQSV